MRRAVLNVYTVGEFFILAVVMLPAFAVATLLHGDRDPTFRARGKVMRFFGRFTSSITPMWRFTVEGQPPPDIHTRGYMVVSNHESNADPFLLSHLPFAMRFVAKEELFKLPLIGWLMKMSGDVRLRRGHGDSVREMMAECRRTLENGLPVMIFPEGTRSKDGNLLPFKDGAFRLAIETQSPVLPLAVRGTRTCLAKGSKLLGEARAVVRILEPIETRGMTMADVESLKSQVRARIEAGRAPVLVGEIHEQPGDEALESVQRRPA